MYFQDTSMFSTQSSTETNKLIKETVDDIVADLDANEDEHIPYRPPSFQDYSSDSAKALMTKYENKGSLTPQAESSRRLPCQVTIRRTRSLEEPKNSTENEEVSPLKIPLIKKKCQPIIISVDYRVIYFKKHSTLIKYQMSGQPRNVT